MLSTPNCPVDHRIERYVVIGNPIAHSMSPAIHTDFAAQLEMPLQYARVLAPLGGFKQTVRALKAAGVQGANVTVPFKLDAFGLADVLSPAAQFAQAANTLIFQADGSIHADNTDGGGLCRDLSRQLKTLGLQLEQCQVLMIGAGGAASGCVAAFHAAGVHHLTVLNRTVGKARELAERAEAIDLPAAGGSLDTPPSHFEIPGAPVVIVNASSSSLNGDVPLIHPAWFERAVLVYDMMYAAQPTPFMQALESTGLPCSDGLGMLVFQAQLAFEVWTGQSPNALETLTKVRQLVLAKAAVQ
ncbi:shikimate dehydrogenase [Limnobacter thiooxidans]|uniref:Shikimate dehydrogenase (NADP(+)) n=1 Tax=Limnobacter thiooxidans TaxID=131080 RepID=A0AA86IZH5_9BURK|nr:shikimate dehydrogenase [Limnobacter thiooxidans]